MQFTMRLMCCLVVFLFNRDVLAYESRFGRYFERIHKDHSVVLNITADQKIVTSSLVECGTKCTQTSTCSCLARKERDCYLFIDGGVGQFPLSVDLWSNDWGVFKLRNSGSDCFVTLTCPGSEWVHHGHSCFYASATKASWDDARVACGAMATGAHLADIKTEDDRTFALDQFDATTGVTSWVWLGANDRANDGMYVWSDGDRFQWNDWINANEPTFLTGEDCIMIVTRKDSNFPAGKFHDYYCKDAYSYMCQVNSLK